MAKYVISELNPLPLPLPVVDRNHLQTPSLPRVINDYMERKTFQTKTQFGVAKIAKMCYCTITD